MLCYRMRSLMQHDACWDEQNMLLCMRIMDRAATLAPLLQSVLALCANRPSGDRTIFQIATKRGVDITAFSSIQSEAELLLPPGMALEIVGCLDAGHGLTIIQ